MHAAANWNGSLALLSRRHIKPGSMDTALISSRFSGLATHSWRSTPVPLMPKALAIAISSQSMGLPACCPATMNPMCPSGLPLANMNNDLTGSLRVVEITHLDQPAASVAANPVPDPLLVDERLSDTNVASILVTGKLPHQR